MKITITGGCGFIGSNLVLSLTEEGHQLQIVDKLTYAASTRDIAGNELLREDISCLSEKAVERIKAFQPEIIIHAAAESMVDRSLSNNKVFFDTNVIGTWRILELIKEIQVEKAIFFSTDEVYGSVFSKFFDEKNHKFGFQEGDKLDPHNPYAGSKAAADQITISYIHNFKLPICIVRPTNNYGPRQHKEKLIPLAITNIINGKKVPIFGSGLNFREWLHVSDTCSAIKTLIHKGVTGKVYNIGSGVRHTNIDVIRYICEALGVSPAEEMQFVQDRLGHDAAYAVNSEAVRTLGWFPTVDLEEGIKQTVEWYKINKDW